MTRNKTETKRLGSLYRSEAKGDQQLHVVPFYDLLLSFLLSVTELLEGTGMGMSHYSRPWSTWGTD